MRQKGEKMKRRILAFMCALAVAGTSPNLLPAFQVRAAAREVMGKSYYISSIHGDNSKSGTSEREAWETLDKLKQVKLEPGDQVLLEKGSVFQGYIHLQDVHGTEEAPIKIGSYGTAEAKPRIDAEGQGVWYQSYNGAVDNQKHRSQGYVSSAILLYDVDFVEVSGLEITNASDDFEFFKGATASASQIDDRMDRTGVSGIAKDGGTMEHVYLDNLYIHNVDGNLEDKHMNNGGIQMNVLPPADEGATGIARYHDVKITNCHVKDVSRAGICVGYTYQSGKFNGKAISDTVAKTYGHTELLFEGNYVQNVGNDGIVAMYAYRPLIQRNVSDRAGADLDGKYDITSKYPDTNQTIFWQPFCAAIWPWKCKDAVFQYNEVFDTVDCQDGQPWDIDWSDGTVYQYNYSHNNGGGCLMICGVEAYQGMFRYNISQNDLKGLIGLADANPQGKIYNNVFYIGKDLNTKMFIDKSNYNGAAELKNNIFYNVSTGKNASEVIVKAGRTYANNIFFGYEGQTLPAGSITADPKFVNPGQAPESSQAGKLHNREVFDGYKLQDDSPAINAGTLTEGMAKYDFFGNQVGAQPDIGAYESGTAETVLALGGDSVLVEDGKIKRLPKTMTVGELKEQLVFARDVSLSILRNGQEAGDGEKVTEDMAVKLVRGSETKEYAVELAKQLVYRDYEPDAQMRAGVTAGNAENGSSQWASSSDSTPASNVLDGNNATIWHTSWDNTSQSDVWIKIDLGSSKPIARFTYVPRQNNTSGIITKYKVEVSSDGNSWTQAAEGTWAGDSSTKYAEFMQVNARYIRLTGIESVPMNGSKPAGSAAEIRVGYLEEEN